MVNAGRGRHRERSLLRRCSRREPTPWSTEARVTAGTVSTETPRRPAGVVDGRPATPRPRAGRSFPGFTALVVDDHPLVRESIVARLRAMGAREVIEAASAHEARARARASGPGNLAILDLGLPDGSGLDLLVELREAGSVSYTHLRAHETV